MAAGKKAVLFDDIIQAGGKQASNWSYGSRKSGGGPAVSLASRIEVAKRSVSSSPTVRSTGERGWSSDSHHHSNPHHPARRSREDYFQARNIRSNALRKAAPLNPRESALQPAQENVGPDDDEINIRGTAPGPYLVVGSNFAPGTTAADIGSAMQPSGGSMLSCSLAQLFPTVTTEVIFTEKENADNVIATFNNKKADGRIISLYIGKSGPSILYAPQNNLAREPNPRFSSGPIPNPR